MWFVIGLVTLVAIAAFVAWWRWDADWSGTRHGAGSYKLATHKGKVQSLRVGIDAELALEFELKLEGWFDRAAKSIGISVEPQANRRGFDDLVYILADDERLVRALRADAALIALFERIGRARLENFRFRRLVCRQGELWIDFKPEKDPGNHLRVADWALEELQALAAALPGLTGQARRVDGTFLRAMVLLGVSGGLAINGGMHLLRVGFGYIPYTVDVGQLWSLTLVAAVFVVLLLAVATLALLGRSARAHLVLLEVLLVGGVGALATCFVEIRDLNMEADTSTAQVYETVVLGKHVTTHRRRRGGQSHTYYLELSDWNGRGAQVDVKVSSSEYTQHLMGQHLEVRQRAGFLGVRWVESIGTMR